MLYGISETGLGLAALAAFLVVIEVGFRLGLRSRAGSDDATKIHVGALQAALLGLLALLLGFTFAMAVSRFDTRKALVLEEANAIGTAYLRGQLLPPPHRQEIATLLEAYVAARLALYETAEPRRLDEAQVMAARLAARLWTVTAAVTAQDPRSVTAGLFVQSLNDVFDLKEKQRTALQNHVPEVVLHLLLTVSVVALGFVAYGAGLTGQRRHVSTSVVAVLIALVLVTILDIDRPRRGLIKVSQESMVRLQESLRGSRP